MCSWADRDVEIVADRGFNGRVSAQEWARSVPSHGASCSHSGTPQQAVVEGIQAVGALIARHFPTADRNELPNRPVIAVSASNAAADCGTPPPIGNNAS